MAVGTGIQLSLDSLRNDKEDKTLTKKVKVRVNVRVKVRVIPCGFCQIK